MTTAFLIYKTTNIATGQYYIGCHQTENIDDGYYGSGKHLTRAIKKYGKSSFKKEILYQCNSKEEMFELEKHLVSESIVKDPLSYNLKIGGSGGNPGIVGAFKGKKHSPKTREKLRKLAANRPKLSEEAKQKLSQNHWSKVDPVAQQHHAKKAGSYSKSAEHRLKIANGVKGKKEIVKCPHCQLEGGQNAMTRWHFNNCKSVNK